MILKNKNGKERELELLLEIEKDNHKYLIYKDYLTNKIYGGKKSRNKLKELSEEEFNYLDNLLEILKEV